MSSNINNKLNSSSNKNIGFAYFCSLVIQHNNAIVLVSKRTTKQWSEHLRRYTVGCEATVCCVVYYTRTVVLV